MIWRLEFSTSRTVLEYMHFIQRELRCGWNLKFSRCGRNCHNGDDDIGCRDVRLFSLGLTANISQVDTDNK